MRPFIKKKATLHEIMDLWNMEDLYNANRAIAFEDELEDAELEAIQKNRDK